MTKRTPLAPSCNVGHRLLPLKLRQTRCNANRTDRIRALIPPFQPPLRLYGGEGAAAGLATTNADDTSGSIIDAECASSSILPR